MFIIFKNDYISMSENSFSNFSAKKFYAIVAIGLIIFAAGTLFAYPAKQNLKADDLPIEELHKQERIYAISKIASMIGFIIALIPSVKILQHAIQNETAKAAETNAGSKKEEDEFKEK
ncbi:hypothetical protein MmiEs2_04060 [Methanimicrococcus stummii]|uniref:Uncharacterized protein n=1 Tax=Methanimicrococcus stummii TaxID=3028294 RepID=A0AA96ZYJ5_9EURY|nr:hypothetical protein [Methanimicrococcus sp. Es2]WNY28222.1 hypothetical protein MmiEs2_04060 [Methanimicrococcus sp. Es2]